MVTEHTFEPPPPSFNAVPTKAVENNTDEMDVDAPLDPREAEVIQVLSSMRHSSDEDSRGFLSRVTNIPVVNTTIRTLGNVYESSKTYPVLKYSVETVESSVKTIYDQTMPVLSKVNSALEPRLGQLDQFACRQLDRLEKNYPIIMEEPAAMYTTSRQVIGEAMGFGARGNAAMPPAESGNGGDPDAAGSASMMARWNHYLSQESLKNLQYCLDWLKYATAHIDQQIQILRDAMTTMTTSNGVDGTAATDGTNTANPISSLLALANRVKHEVVETLRRVVDILGKYAGVALPLDARNRVRGFILSLPSRWATVDIAKSDATTSASAEQEAQRVLTLAHESNSMLKSTMVVIRQTFETAHYWFGRPGAEAAVITSDALPVSQQPAVPMEPLQPSQN